MAAAAQCAAPTPKRYQRRRPERTLWYRIVQTHLETWLELASGEDGGAPPAHIERTFRRYLECGILAHGFARAYCDECQHDFLIAYSCKCRGVCPSCNTRRMAETAAHLVDHVFPPLPVRQWVLAVPKRLRYFLQADAALQGTVLRIFLSVVERCLREHSPSSPADARIGAVAFIHRFGSSLNEHVHFHCCVIDGVFEPAVAPDEAPSVSFHAALGLDAAAFADVQARVRTRVLSTFVRRGLIDKDDAAEMRVWAHDGGFSVDGSVRIEGADRTGLERLVRYCARPPFALEHLHQRDAEHLVYRNPKPVRGTAPGTRPAALVLTPLELITKIAALVPPPRAHRHRYYGVLAPNASLRAVVTALAPAAVSPAPTIATREEPRHRTVARYLWAALHAQQDGAGQDPARIAAECCWRASTRLFRCNARSATHPCASSPSSMISLPWARSSTTSANPPSHRASPRRAGHRCGRRQRLRNRRRTILSGIRQPSPHRRSSSISASPGRRGGGGSCLMHGE